eukprot:7138949-Pyramimonas_sp.AAC.1
MPCISVIGFGVGPWVGSRDTEITVAGLRETEYSRHVARSRFNQAAQRHLQNALGQRPPWHAHASRALKVYCPSP